MQIDLTDAKIFQKVLGGYFFDTPCTCVFSDIEIAMAQSPKDISELASEIGLLPHEVDFYGKKKAKVSLKVLDRLSRQQNGNYVIVTGSVCVSLGQVIGSLVFC